MLMSILICCRECPKRRSTFLLLFPAAILLTTSFTMPPSRDHPPDPPLDEQKPLSTRAPAEYNSNPFEVLSPLSLPGNATATPFDTPLSTPFGASSSTRASGSTVSSGTALARLLGYPAGKTE